MTPATALLPVALATCLATVPAAALDILGTASGRYVFKVTSLKEAKFKATVRQQYDYSCGSAALATLLTHHYGFPVSEQTVFEEMFARGDQQKIQREGFSLLDMKVYLRAHGFQADGFELPLEKLLESGLPAIVLIAERNYHHFVVVKGMRDGRVLLGDPSNGARTLPRQALKRFGSTSCCLSSTTSKTWPASTWMLNGNGCLAHQWPVGCRMTGWRRAPWANWVLTIFKDES